MSPRAIREVKKRSLFKRAVERSNTGLVDVALTDCKFNNYFIYNDRLGILNSVMAGIPSGGKCSPFKHCSFGLWTLAMVSKSDVWVPEPTLNLQRGDISASTIETYLSCFL